MKARRPPPTDAIPERPDAVTPLPSSDRLGAKILALLPTDGTPVLNRIMRAMLTRELQTLVDQDDYFAARDRLFDAGQIGRRRGQGGQIFLASDKAADPPTSPQVQGVKETWSEAALMAPLGRYLAGPFARESDIGDGCTVVQDISRLGAYQGRWTRPDYLFVSAMRFKLLPGVQVDVHAFELKTESGGSVFAVHEALAQTRFTHFGHLVWHLPEGSKAEARLAEIAAQCEAHGVGLIRMRDPDRLEDAEILLDPKRKATPPAIVDAFLERRLSEDNRTTLRRVVHGTGPWPAS